MSATLPCSMTMPATSSFKAVEDSAGQPVDVTEIKFWMIEL